MSRLARIGGFLTRRARLVVAVWLLLVAVLAMQGRGLDDELNLRPLFVDGTQSKRVHEIALREFGSEYPMVVLLRGPGAAVERQGRTLAARFSEMPHVIVASPWSPGAPVKGLRPAPGVGALIVRPQSGDVDEAAHLLVPVERQVDAVTTDRVEASIAGFPSVVDSLRRANDEATKIGELVAMPVLLLVLLLVFRSVIAALIPVIVGGAVVAASRGVLSLMLGVVELDLFVAGVVGMMGLALGVDYSLLVISRFREQERGDVPAAVRATVEATTRSVVPAGCGLVVAMLMAVLVLPGSIGRSVAIAVITVTVLSVLSALCVVPALLTLLGDNLDRWSLPRRATSQTAPLRWSRRLAGRPRAVAAMILLLLFFSAWATTLDSGVADIGLLPADDPGRVQQEEVERALGPGWLGPIEVIMNGRGSPVTSPERLRALADFQRQVERDPGVEAVAGFAAIESGAEKLTGIEDDIAAQERGLERLDTGISKLHQGATLNTKGLLAAAEGGRQLGSGLGAANAGAGLLAESLQGAGTGSRALSQGFGRVDQGGEQLAEGAAKASSGAARLADGLRQAQEKTGEMRGSARLLENAMRSGDGRLGEVRGPLRATDEQLSAAWRALQRMTTGRSDPEYDAVARALEAASRQLSGRDIRTGGQVDPSYAGVARGVERAEAQLGVGLYLASTLEKNGRQAEDGMKKLARGSARLDRGLGRLASGSRQLSGGIARLAQGGGALSPGLVRLGAGAERLVGGLERLERGAGQLAGGLGGGAQKSKLMTGALRKIGTGLDRQGGDEGGGQLDQLRAQAPGIFRSGYFVLAGLDGSRPARREQLGFLLNLDRGGEDARMLVIPRGGPTTPEAEETTDRIVEVAGDLARQTGTEVVVGGVGPGEIDVNEALRDQAPLLRLALSLVSFLVLVPVVRSLTLPLLAALFNLLTVSAAFGLLSLLFNDSLLGGPGYVDATVIPATMIVMFGLAIDYEVFVFARMREEYLRTGSPQAAIRNGLDHTAHVVTGAAVIMIAVFLAFSISSFTPIRNFGVAQAIGIFIDAFIIRLVVIPLVMGKLGRWSWWMPAWLDRLLPGGSAVAPRTAAVDA